MEFDRKVFASRIKKARIAKQLKQVQLAGMVGVSRDTIVNLENDKVDNENGCKVSISRVFKIAEVLDVSIDYLCGKDKGNNCISINANEIAETIVNKFTDSFEFCAISHKEISNKCGITECNLLKLKKLVNSKKTSDLELINKLICHI